MRLARFGLKVRLCYSPCYSIALHAHTINASNHPHKHRRGLARLRYAFVYSLQGLLAGVRTSPAFRLELALAGFGFVLAFLLGRNWLEVVFLLAVLVLVLIVEMLNCGIEAAIDRVGFEIHPLSKLAKDYGSAAVFLSLVLCAGVWLSLLCVRLVAY